MRQCMDNKFTACPVPSGSGLDRRIQILVIMVLLFYVNISRYPDAFFSCT